jgi:hypothetical protein
MKRVPSPPGVGRVVALGFTLTAWLMAPVSPASAEGDLAVCTFEAHESANPGWWMATPTHGHGGADGAPITCSGTVGGKAAGPGPGVISYGYTYGADQTVVPGGDNCATTAAHGTWTATLPAGGSTVTLTGPFVVVAVGGVAGRVSGRLGTADVDGTVEARPDPDHLDEDCVNKPLRHFIATAQVVLRGGR